MGRGSNASPHPERDGNTLRRDPWKEVARGPALGPPPGDPPSVRRSRDAAHSPVPPAFPGWGVGGTGHALMPSVSAPPPSGPSAPDPRTKAAGSLARECPAAARPAAAHSPHFLHTQPHTAGPGPPRTARSGRAPVRGQDAGLCSGLGLPGQGLRPACLSLIPACLSLIRKGTLLLWGQPQAGVGINRSSPEAGSLFRPPGHSPGPQDFSPAASTRRPPHTLTSCSHGPFCPRPCAYDRTRSLSPTPASGGPPSGRKGQ